MKIRLKRWIGLSLTSLSLLTVSNAAIAQNGSYQGNGGGYYSNTAYNDYDENDQNRDSRGAREENDRRGRSCSKGTTGLVVGAVVGGLLGKAVVGRRGDRTSGMIVGAGAGALAGRAIEKSRRNRC